MAKQVRILVDTRVDGTSYGPNAVVEFDDKTAKTLEKSGVADSAPEAVAYCVEQLGASVVVHGQQKEAASAPQQEPAVQPQ